MNGQVSKCICLGCKIYLSENQKYLQTRSWKPILKEHFMAKMTPTIRKEARTTPMSSLPGRRRKLESFFLWIQMMTTMTTMIHNIDKELFKGKKEACLHVVAQETWLVGGSVCIPIWDKAVVFLSFYLFYLFIFLYPNLRQSSCIFMFFHVFLYLNKQLIAASVFTHVFLSITDDW